MEYKIKKNIDVLSFDRLYLALAGTGKSFHLIQDAVNAVNEGKNILYLSFNRKIRTEVIKNTNLPKEFVHTFHSLAYSEIFNSDYLSEIPLDYTPEELLEYFEDNSKYYFPLHDKKFTEFKENIFKNLIPFWCNNAKNSSYKNLDYIFIDEVQDINRDMIRMLHILIEINDNQVKLIGAGDPYQTINNFNNAGKDNKIFSSIKKNISSTELIHLNDNYRNSPSIQKFVNGYYELQYSDNRFFDLSKYAEDQFTDDVYIHSIQHKRELYNTVYEIIKLYPSKRITIIGRVNKEIENLNFSDNRIQVSSIHADKGNTYDVAIVVNTIFNDKLDSIEAKNLWNVAITRSKEKLHIVSSFPQEIILSKFKTGTYIHIDRQYLNSVSNIKNISEDEIFLTNEKISKSIIDSLELQLNFDNACFIPYEKQNLKKYSKFKTDTRLTIKNFNFVLHRLCNKYSKNLIFDFSDLSQLKNQGFDDRAILQYIEDVQKEYFSRLCTDDDINQQKLKRLDLSQYYKVPSDAILNTLFLFFKLSRYKDSNLRSILLDGNNGTKTAYLNSYLYKRKAAKNKKYRGIRAYFPYGKENENRLHDGINILKLELYRELKSDLSGSGSMKLSFSELKQIVAEDRLTNLYYDWLYFEFPYLKDEPVKNIELIKSRLNIYTLDDVIQIIDSGNIHIRDKRNLFYVLLSLIDKDEASVIKDIFKIKK